MKPKLSKKVSILVLEGCTPWAPVSAMEILNKAGEIHQEIAKTPTPYFRTELVGVKSKMVRSTPSFKIDCDTTLDQVKETDLLIIPAMEFDVKEKIQQNKSALPHILRLYHQGTEVASLCTGAFLLAATGLLHHKSATTHWYSAAQFRSMFPDIRLEDQKIIIDEGGIYTSGGASSSMHLGLYITEKYCGKETANMATRMLLLDTNDASQARYSMFIPQKLHSDEAIRHAQRIIEEDQEEKYSVQTLADSVHLSRRSFIRRFKSATGNTPVEYLQRMNVEKAKRLLEKSKSTVEEIIYSLGYNDIHSFRKLFVRYTDLTPKEYRVRYGLQE
jgi:transcriptional regulator GlxA family with amidase domain